MVESVGQSGTPQGQAGESVTRGDRRRRELEARKPSPPLDRLLLGSLSASGGNWWFKFRPAGGALVTGYGFATRELAAAAESASRRAAQAGKLEAMRALLAPAPVVTVGQLAIAWTASGYSRANRRPRTAGQQRTQAMFLRYLLEWWEDRNAATITGPDLGNYAEWRRLHSRAGATGDRTIDVELGVLSNLFQWAVAVGQAKANPFASRPRFQDATEIEHCHEFMPESDEELHRLCGWLMAQPATARARSRG
jgi:hypothetical protein